MKKLLLLQHKQSIIFSILLTVWTSSLNVLANSNSISNSSTNAKTDTSISLNSGGKAACIKLLQSTTHSNNLKFEDEFKQAGAPLDALDYSKIQSKDFEFHFKMAYQEAQKRVHDIKTNSAEPNYKNTIEALENVDAPLAQLKGVFNLFSGLKLTPEITEIEEHNIELSSNLRAAITYDADIFKRVQKVYQNRLFENLSPEQIRLTELTYLGFTKSGAELSADQQKKLLDLDKKIASLSQKFSLNLINEDKESYIHFTAQTQVIGLPQDVLIKGQEKAKEKNLKGWVFDIRGATVTNLLKNLRIRQSRKQIWSAYSRRGTDPKYDNRAIILEIAKLRAEKSKILGFSNYADFVTNDRMAKNSKIVSDFLEQLKKPYYQAAAKDLAELENFAGQKLEAWDFAFYSEKLKQKKFNIDSESVKQYLVLDRVLNSAFDVAKKLYQIEFRARPELKTWDSSVRVFEVFDLKQNKSIALFYFDPFSRDGKSAGAWMDNIKPSGFVDLTHSIPHIINALNIIPPTRPEGPALVELSDVRTIFHELGHALHSILNEVPIRSLAGPEVALDLVELPSQIMENWAFTPEVVKTYAFHYQTHEPLDLQIIQNIHLSDQFQSGWIGLRQVFLASLDQSWYTQDLSKMTSIEDVENFESNVKKAFQLLPPNNSLTSTSFSHIFSGGYSAGYYSYKWAEVLSADAFAVFKSTGIFNTTTAEKFRKTILAKGNSVDAFDLYRDFKGSDADIKALLIQEGL